MCQRKLNRSPPPGICPSGGHLVPVDLAEGLSKLAPPLTLMAVAHEQIRQRTRRPASSGTTRTRRQTLPSETALLAAQSRYETGAKLSEIASDLGVSRQRLTSLLRGRGVRLRRSSPSQSEVNEMVCRYAAGESLERVASHSGFSAGTVRNWLTTSVVKVRDSHGRER